MHLLAGIPGLQWIILGLTAPTIAILLVLSFTLAQTLRQRMANLLTGSACSVVVVITFMTWVEMGPNERSDNSLYVFVVAPLGAAFGVAFAKGVARFKKIGRNKR